MSNRTVLLIAFAVLIFPMRPDPFKVEAGAGIPRMYLKMLGEDAFFWTEDIPDSLSRVRVLHVGFDGSTRVGELVCHRRVAPELMDIFRELYEAGYQIESILPIDRWNGDDEASMAANNTSAYNNRLVRGTSIVSRHAFGYAVDVNPLYNPCVKHGKVMPEAAAPYADRTRNFNHKITASDICCRIFRAHGWEWGGNWASSKDYQHFQKSSR